MLLVFFFVRITFYLDHSYTPNSMISTTQEDLQIWAICMSLTLRFHHVCTSIPHLISVKKLSSHWANHLKFIQKIRAKFEFGLATFFLFWSYALCFAKKCQYLRFPFNNQSYPLGNELKFICKSMNHTRQAELDIVFFSLWSYVPWFVNNTNFCFLFNNWSSP